MFNIFKKENKTKKEMIGTIERIGIAPSSEFTLKYFLKMKDCPTVFEYFMAGQNSSMLDVIFAKEGDNVSFIYGKRNDVEQESFKNLSYKV